MRDVEFRNYLMVILNCEAGEIKKLQSVTAEMSSDISLEQEVFLSILLRDKKHYENNLDCLPLYRNIAEEGVAVYG